MKTNKICTILAIILVVVISGCNGPPGPTKEQIDADKTIQYLEKEIPILETHINSINIKITNAKSKNIATNGSENIIQNIQQKLSEIKSDLINARSYFNSQNYVLSNQTAQYAKNKLENYLKYEFNLADEKLTEGFLKYDIQETEKTLSYLKNQSQSFKEKVSTADNEGVNIANINKYIQESDQYIYTAESNLNAAKSELYNKRYEDVYTRINSTSNEFNKIQNTINQGLKNLQDEYSKSIEISKKLISKADFEIRKAELYLTDAQNNGIDISNFKDRYEQAKTLSTDAIDDLSSRKFRIVKSKTENAIESSIDIENEVLDKKYDTISENLIQKVSNDTKGDIATNYIKSAEQSRSDKKYEESALFVNKAIISTGIYTIEDEIYNLEKFSDENRLNLNLQNIKNSMSVAKEELNKNEIENSLDTMKKTKILTKNLTDSINNYIGARSKIQEVKKLSFLWIVSDTSDADEYLSKSFEMINNDNFEESAKLSNMALESAKEVENKIVTKINNNMFLRLIKIIKNIIPIEKDIIEKIKITDISYLKLENVEFKPPEINIEMKSLNTNTPSIDFQKVSFTQTSISGSNIDRIKKLSARVDDIDCNDVKLGNPNSYAYITIYNDGEEVIIDEYVDILVGRDFGWPAGYRTRSKQLTLSDTIDPKTNRRLVNQLSLPVSEQGYNLEGHYNARMMIFVNNKNIYTKDGSIHLSTGGSQCQFN